MLKRRLNPDSRGVPPLSVWTVYERSRHRPARYVAAQQFIGEEGQTIDGELLVSDTLAEVRAEMRARRLVCLARADADDPRIVEVWL
jgi:hypothetical protein